MCGRGQRSTRAWNLLWLVQHSTAEGGRGGGQLVVTIVGAPFDAILALRPDVDDGDQRIVDLIQPSASDLKFTQLPIHCGFAPR